MNLFKGNLTMKLIYFAALSFLIFSLSGCFNSQNNENKITIDSDFQKIIKNNEINVGYIPYPPGLIKDPNTGELSGIFYDTLMEIGKSLNLEINWVEEVTWATMIEGLKTNRYDMIGSPVWANSSRAKIALFSDPLFYSGIGVYARIDEDRFTNNMHLINTESIKISTIDGEMASIIANSDFPDAKKIALPQLSDVSQMLLEVESGKADITFVEPYLAQKYNSANRNSIKNLTPENPVRIFPNSFVFNSQEYALKSMINIAIKEQINSGSTSKLIEKYTGSKTAFYQTALPYRSE